MNANDTPESLIANQPRRAQLIQVRGEGGCRQIQLLAQLTHRQAGRTDLDQDSESVQPSFVAERRQCGERFVRVHKFDITGIIELYKYARIDVVQRLNSALPQPSESAMPYTPILATLGYVLSPDGRQVLMVHRNARPDDEHLGKYNGLGGKLEPNEDVVAGMAREIAEEAQIECQSMRLRGTINWPGFGRQGEDWFGFIFLIDRFSGTPPASNAEGDLEWIDRDRLLDLPMWEGDRHFLPLIFDADPRPFHGVMPYAQGRMQSWQFSRADV